MGKISALFVRKVVHQVDAKMGQTELLRHGGIDAAVFDNPAQMVSDTDNYIFLEKMAAVDRDGTTLPLRAGASMRCDDYGAFGLAWKSALNLLGAYQRAERYARVLTSVSTYEIERTPEGAYLHLHRQGDRRLGMRLSNEATIASIMSISQEVMTQPFHPTGVYFKHGAPKSIAAHQAYFGCPVHYGVDRDALQVPNDLLHLPNKLGDDGISRFFDSHMETQVAGLSDEDALNSQVCHHVSQALSSGVPSLSTVAKRMGMSGRTLQRRLADRGVSFQKLVDDSRRQLAMRLLQQTRFSLDDVAFMTGFSEQSAFARAFRRWENQTPRSYRIASQS